MNITDYALWDDSTQRRQDYASRVKYIESKASEEYTVPKCRNLPFRWLTVCFSIYLVKYRLSAF
jgi:hypothetical protein